MGQVKLDIERFLLEKAQGIAIFCFLVTVPIFFVADVKDLRWLQERYFQAGAMFLGSLFFNCIWLTLFFWLNLALFIFHGGVVGSSQVLSIFLTGIIFACSKRFFTQTSFKPYVTALYIVTVLSIIMMVFQAFGVDFITTPVGQDGEPMANTSSTLKQGLFFLPPFNAIFLTVTAAFAIFLLPGWWKVLGFLLIGGAIDARSSACFLAWAFLVPFWVYWTKRKWFIHTLLIMACCMSLYSFKDFSGDKMTYKSRFESWHMIAKYSSRNLLGWGPDSFRNYNDHKNFTFLTDKDYNPILSEMPDKNTEIMRYHSADAGKWKERFGGKIPGGLNNWAEAHNDYLQGIFEYGIFFVVLLCFFFREVYLRFHRSDKSPEVLALFAALCVYALVATTQFPFHLARLSGIFGVILGAYFAITNSFYKQENRNEV